MLTASVIMDVLSGVSEEQRQSSRAKQEHVPAALPNEVAVMLLSMSRRPFSRWKATMDVVTSSL